jgi:hypothetical protein
MALITIFSAPKPFTNPHIALIQRNAIRSWLELGPDVDVLLIGEEDGLAEAAADLGARHIPTVERNAQGTPLVSSIFQQARQNSSSPLLAFVNADIMLLPDFVTTAREVAGQTREFLMVGQRWDMAVKEVVDFSPGWSERLLQRAQQENRLHPRGGSDYFIFRREAFVNMPPLAVGRAGWDNWMIYEARCRGAAVVDATGTINIMHQDHDYSHLPNGQPHYRLPETFENVRMAGGRQTIFKLEDTNYRLEQGKLRSQPVTWAKFWRELEIFPLVRLHSRGLGILFRAAFHPKRVYRELRSRSKTK